MTRVFSQMTRLVAGILLLCWSPQAAGQPRLLTLENRPVDPFQAAPGVKAIVFLFTSTDCPISNRYAPDVRRLYEMFAGRGVRFWLVYPNPAELPSAIRTHLQEYGYPMPALRDPHQDLVGLAGATVTPEAAVFDTRARMLYRGRIDDRYVEVGLDRPSATTHDLEDAVASVLAGRTVPQPTTRAVGCYLADFLRK